MAADPFTAKPIDDAARVAALIKEQNHQLALAAAREREDAELRRTDPSIYKLRQRMYKLSAQDEEIARRKQKRAKKRQQEEDMALAEISLLASQRRENEKELARQRQERQEMASRHNVENSDRAARHRDERRNLPK